jgi:hypothetical protein
MEPFYTETLMCKLNWKLNHDIDISTEKLKELIGKRFVNFLRNLTP